MDIPQIIAGRFRVECEIGRGGMGTVYRASHLGLERPVAIKILKQEFAAHPEIAERFMREARTMARLKHPRGAMIFDAGHLADGRPFIVMEYVEGSTLAETLAREGTFAPERAVRVASEICDVLSEAHALGIVHRDLKPSNIILNERGVCVLDFGIAKVLQDSTEMTRTHATTESGLVIGTPRYMSPEQCLGHRVGPATDLYSVGVLLYEMLAGRTPFVDQHSSVVLVKQATAQPTPLQALRPDVPRSLALAVHTLLAKNPAHRPASAAEASRMVERAVAPERRENAMCESEPFANTISALNSGRYTFTRVATLFALLAMAFTVLVAWSARAGQSGALEDAARDPAATASALLPRKQRAARRAEAPVLTRDGALHIASSLTHGRVTDVRVVGTGAGQLVAAVAFDPADSTTGLFVIERGGARGAYSVTTRVPLDVEGFRGADWTEEIVDLDGDGYDEVLCAGADPSDGAVGSRRYVVYTPRQHETYSLHLAPDSTGAHALRATWSPNTQGRDAQLFRYALRQRALVN
ncbi:MAG: eukaryotic-like serine/threonine-protein kinase [Acidobacteriota bacterium]|jgi:tRNA A-37 threonylcarbamoyl transferase component Bud32|nr:eukaryotic-like serine/threonine-protein kinase [Acidobacteriota bacterium]